MAELKDRKYFLNELLPDEKQKGFGKNPIFIVMADNDIIEGCNFFTAMMMGESAAKKAGHGPHVHKTAEMKLVAEDLRSKMIFIDTEKTETGETRS